MADTYPGIEHSPLCGKVTRDNETVDVRIYRLPDGDAAWSLEVIDADGGSTVWDDLFDTDQAAYAEFFITVEREGIACFREAPANLHWN
ncbi:hypothetical protein [Bosea sp. (in: a-proteobacteria)]|uniref:hypothetical protein n=1 Tax=Bosea sp. (in: a-proteobacteria) TaxID=1871050 RepID=UPI002B47676C|nr:hypothetical protein [Bosea sp. (in: a-proteobacteria)]WRH56682.1 MAG: hypothetical protein RSE11_16770 [Bosea sp. (in: a-proteobacteria)]